MFSQAPPYPQAQIFLENILKKLFTCVTPRGACKGRRRGALPRGACKGRRMGSSGEGGEGAMEKEMWRMRCAQETRQEKEPLSNIQWRKEVLWKVSVQKGIFEK